MLRFPVNKSQCLRDGMEFWTSILLWSLAQVRRHSFQIFSPAALPQRNSLVLTSVKRLSGSQCYQLRTLTGIESGTSRLVAHCLHQLWHRTPPLQTTRR